MESYQHSDETITKSKLARWSSTAAKILVAPVTAATAFFTGDVMIRNAVYKNFARHGFFDGKKRSTEGPQGQFSEEFHTIVRDKYEERIAKAATAEERNRLASNAHAFNVIDKSEMPALAKKLNLDSVPEVTSHMLEVGEKLEKGNTKGRISNLFKGYRKDVRSFFADLEMKGMKDYSKGLTRNQKMEALVFVAGSMAITVGAAVGIMEYGKEYQEKMRRSGETSENGRGAA